MKNYIASCTRECGMVGGFEAGAKSFYYSETAQKVETVSLHGVNLNPKIMQCNGLHDFASFQER